MTKISTNIKVVLEKPVKNAILLLGLLFSFSVYAVEDSTEKNLETKTAPEQICIAAMQSKAAAKAKAVELGVGRRQMTRILCDEHSVMDFAAIHAEEDITSWSIATVE